MVDNDDNGSHHSDTPAVDPVLSEAQMQMLRGMIAQAKEDGRAEGCAEASVPRRPAADLPRRPDQGPRYPDRRDLPRRRRYDPDPDDPDDPDEPASDASRGRRNDDNDTRFRPEEVGFFNPHLDTKDYGPGDIVDAGGKTYFRDVHLFIDFFRMSPEPKLMESYDEISTNAFVA